MVKYYKVENILFYAVFFVYPFTALQINVFNMNIPLTDLIGIMLFSVFIYKLIGGLLQGQKNYIINLQCVKFYLIFLLVVFANIFHSHNFNDSIKYFFRFPVFAFFIYYVVLGSLMVNTEMRDRKNLYHVLCTSTLFLSILSIVVSVKRIMAGDLYGFSEIPYLTNNHKTLATTIATNIPLLLAVRKLSTGLSIKYYGLSIMIAMTAIFLSFSKTAWMAIVITIVMNYGKNYHKVKLFGKLMILLMFALIASMSFFAYSFLSKIQDIVYAEAGRFFLAAHAVNMFIESPAFGGGIGSFVTELKKYQHVLKRSGVPTLAEFDAHGLFFKLMSETGIIGTVLFLMFYVTIIKSLIRCYRAYDEADTREKTITYGFIMTTIVLLSINSFFGTDAYVARFWFVLSFASVHITWYNRSRYDNRRKLA